MDIYLACEVFSDSGGDLEVNPIKAFYTESDALSFCYEDTLEILKRMCVINPYIYIHLLNAKIDKQKYIKDNFLVVEEKYDINTLYGKSMFVIRMKVCDMKRDSEG